MRIFYFGSFEKTYDTEVYIAESLKALGHDVVCIDRKQIKFRDLSNLVKSENPDFILVSKGWTINVIRDQLKSSEILSVGWFFDLLWGTHRETMLLSNPVFSTDLVFTTDGGHDQEFANKNIKHRLLRQGIFEPEAVIGKPRKEFECDVLFVGGDGAIHKNYFGWDHRQKLVRFLRKTYGDRFMHVGTTDNQIRNLNLNDLFASAKVVVGDSVYSPNYWSNRIYESLGRGAFLIHPAIPGLEKEFEYGKHFVPYNFNDWDTLKVKIDYYLDHPQEREKIKMAGFNYCKENYTYKIRCQQLIEEIQKNIGTNGQKKVAA